LRWAVVVFAQRQAARYQDLAKTQLAGTVQNAQKYTSQLNESRPQLRVRKRRSNWRSGKSKR